MNQPGGFHQRDGGANTQSPGGRPTPIDIMYLYSVLRVNLGLVIAVTVLAAVGMFIYLQRVSPIYSADAQVVLDTRTERVTPVDEVVSNLDISNSVVAGEVVTIRSNILLGEVVDTLDLTHDPAYDPRVPQHESLFAWLKRMARWGEPPHIVAQSLPDETIRSWVIDSVRRRLTVSQIGVSYVIAVTYEDSDPDLAAKIANTVADRYIASLLAAKLDASKRANAWLADRLVELSVQVEEADGAVVDFKAEMIEMAEGSEDSINQLLAELNSRLVASSTERADAEVRLGQVEALLTTGGIHAVADVVTSPLLETLSRQRADLAADQAQRASTLGRRHPDMIRIAAQLADIDRSIETELQRRVEEMRSDVIVTRNREGALKSQIDVVSDRADSLSRASVRLAQLERTSQATRVVYENFLARYKETTAQGDFQTSEARVIGRADVPVVPSKPRKTLLMIAATLVGFCGAVVFVFLRNLVRAPVATVDELRALTGRPNLAVLPYVPHIGSHYKWLKIELSDAPKTTYLERVKSIRTALFDTTRSRPPKILMITSAVPNEGKTALCCALGKALQRSRSSTLIVDADLRRPDIRNALGLPNEGFCMIDYLENDGNLKDLVQHSEEFNINVVSPSRRYEDASDLLSGPKFANLLNRLSVKYSTIIVNAPPVIYLADAVLLSRLADATLLTVRSSSTPAKNLRNAIHRLEAAGGKVEGTVLSMVRRTDSEARGADFYGYGY